MSARKCYVLGVNVIYCFKKEIEVVTGTIRREQIAESSKLQRTTYKLVSYLIYNYAYLFIYIVYSVITPRLVNQSLWRPVNCACWLLITLNGTADGIHLPSLIRRSSNASDPPNASDLGSLVGPGWSFGSIAVCPRTLSSLCLNRHQLWFAEIRDSRKNKKKKDQRPRDQPSDKAILNGSKAIYVGTFHSWLGNCERN